MVDRQARTLAARDETEDGSQPGELERFGHGGEMPAWSSLEGRARIGRFLLLERLGAGGMGQVFSAYDPVLDRKVAIKLVGDRAHDSASSMARIKQEAQAMARVSHPNVVHVYETGDFEGRVFIVMEIVDGGSLAHWQRRRDLGASREVEARLRLYLQAAAGLFAAHRSGLIHRDFKPDNVLVGTDGRVRVADFGLARMRVDGGLHGDADTDAMDAPDAGEHARRLTRAGAILGTLGYMSPEQAGGAEADERSDQFSFCAALYEAVYGRRPFPAEGLEEYRARVRSNGPEPPPPSEVPLVIERAILRGLSRDPTDRFPSMQPMIEALEEGLRPESEPLLTRTDKIRIAVGLVAAVALSAVTNIAVIGLTGSESSLLRATVVMSLFFGVALALLRRPPWPIRHRARYRGLIAFLLVVSGSLIVARVAAMFVGLAASDYYVVECVLLAALYVVESLRVGLRHALLAVPALVYAPFVVLLPGLRIVLYNAVIAGTVLGSILVHMRQALPSESTTDLQTG